MAEGKLRQECAWNYFDMVLAVSGLVDVSVQLVGLDMPDAGHQTCP